MANGNSLYQRLFRTTENFYRLENFVCNALLFIQIIAVSLLVFSRYVLSRSFGWGEELSLLCMVWFTMLSVGIGFRNENHIRMTVLDRLLPDKGLLVISVFNDIVVFVFAGALFKYGLDVVFLNINRLSASLRISVGVLYASVPVGALFMMVMLALKLFLRIMERRGVAEAHDA